MHEIQILIGATEALEPIRDLLEGSVIRELDCELAVLPLAESCVAVAAGSEGFEWPDLERPSLVGSLRRELAPLLRMIRQSKPPGVLALILTQYWGGAGTQVAIQFSNGEVVWGPTLGEGAVNEALRHMGVVARPGSDEWDTVGLTDWRTTESVAGGAGS